MEFNPRSDLKAVDRKLPTILFTNLGILQEAFGRHGPVDCYEEVIKRCGPRNIAKQLLKRIEDLSVWGSKGFTTVLSIIQTCQEIKGTLVVFVDEGVYYGVVDSYWKMVQHGNGKGATLTLPEVGWMANYLLATLIR